MTTNTQQQPYTVIPIRARKIGDQKKGHTLPPRYDLQPMTHDQACTFARKCRNWATDYLLHPWPEEIPFPSTVPSFPHPFVKNNQ